MSEDVERWKRELEAAGWNAASATAWYAPDGGLYRGPYGAWEELQRRRGVLTATDADAAKAREIIGNVNNYAEDDGELSISAFGPLSTRIAEALATVRKEEREAAFKEVIEIASRHKEHSGYTLHQHGSEALDCRNVIWRELEAGLTEKIGKGKG